MIVKKERERKGTFVLTNKNRSMNEEQRDIPICNAFMHFDCTDKYIQTNSVIPGHCNNRTIKNVTTNNCRIVNFLFLSNSKFK